MTLRFFNTTPVLQAPMSNTISTGLNFDDMLRYVSKRIVEQVRNSPELIGILDTLVTDHFGGEIDLFDSEGRPLTPIQEKKRRLFFENNNIDQTFAGQGLDYFMDGSSFGWAGNSDMMLSNEQKAALSSLSKYFNNTKTSKKVLSSIKEELEKPRKISYLAASTVEILNDEYGIIGYKQDVNGKKVIWSPDNIVHIKLMEFNGEPRGMSGLKALSKEIALMYMIKENLIAKLQNGGSADNIIYLKNSQGANKARFLRLQSALESFSHLKKSHGNMPIDAEVGVVPLGTTLKDMEYRELAMFTISEFCLGLGVPISRINFLMTGSGGATNKGEMSSNSDKAYDEKINNRRKNWEIRWNRQFRKLGFTFKFRRTNLQDEIRETQALTQIAAYVTEVENLLSKTGKQLKLSTKLAMLSGKKMNISEDDVEKSEFNNSIPNNAMTNLASEIDTSSLIKRNRSEAKRNTANNNGVSV
jgi:hypothetical protein